VLSVNEAAWAQLAGERSYGNSLSRRPGAGSGSRLQWGGRLWERGALGGTSGGTAGAATGATDLGESVRERLARGARGSDDFVGTDAAERRSFVGAQQSEAAEPVISAQEGLEIEQSPDANQGQTRTATPSLGMYDPRLRVSFDFPQRPAADVTATLARRLQTSSAIRRLGRIEVSLEGQTATLRGAVASERDRSLARLLVLFEPGISSVKDELTVPTGRPHSQTDRPPAHAPSAAETPPATQGPRSGSREF
jgi:hypothetical protein